MIQIKQKKCKGTGKAKGYGCGELVTFRRYGLCSSCLAGFLFHSDPGKEILKKTTIRAKKKVQKESKPKRKYVRWQEKEFSEMIEYVQDNIVNPYIRARDFINHRYCISSGKKIVDAGHFYPISSTPRLRFCCQNIHGQHSHDNRYNYGNQESYIKGLINRFGQSYYDTLVRLKDDCNKWPKLDKIDLIEIGTTYQKLTDKQIWVFEHEIFENYRKIMNK